MKHKGSTQLYVKSIDSILGVRELRWRVVLWKILLSLLLNAAVQRQIDYNDHLHARSDYCSLERLTKFGDAIVDTPNALERQAF